MSFGTQLPQISVPPPGPRSRALLAELAAVESRNVTFSGDRFPVVWEEARGANVRDADGNVLLDLTAAFGVALAGHGHPRVVAAVRAQSERLLHGMGDVHPPAIKARLLRRLAPLLPWDDARIVLALGGSEAVEIALKTALLATGRPGFVAFEGGYHGLTAGALAAGQWRFREPFRQRLYRGVARVAFPDPLREREEGMHRALEALDTALEEGAPNGDAIGAVLVEPIQGRAGIRFPPAGFQEGVSERAHAHGALVIADEVFTGMGRTGSLLAGPGLGLRPDLVCIGKALGGGLPFSACAGPASVMDAWPPSTGEALHTSTFLGHPLACAAALAFLDVLEEENLAERAQEVGAALLEGLNDALAGVAGVAEVRGMGLLIGIELAEPWNGQAPGVGEGTGGHASSTPAESPPERRPEPPLEHETTAGAVFGAKLPPGPPLAGAAIRVAEAALRRGVLVLPAGEVGHVVELTPPAVLTPAQIEAAVTLVAASVREVVG